MPREEIDILKDSEQKFIILNAYKGTGKSAAFIDAANSLNPEKDLVILKYDSTIIPTHNNSDFNNWICLWRQKIAECIALELINQENWKWDLKDLKEKLKSITLIIHALNKGYPSSIFSLISAIKRNSSVEIKTLDINDIEILAKNYIGKKSVWLFLDEMDQNFCAFNDSERVKIAALLKASYDMTKFFSDLKIRISIRPNVLSVLQKEYSCLSGLRQYIVNLDWNTSLLKKVLSKRIESYLQREKINFFASSEDSFINLLFDGEFDLGKGKRQVSQFISKFLTSSLKKPQYYNWLINNIL